MIRRTQLRKVSKKRAKDMKTYALLRSAFLKAHPRCQACKHRPEIKDGSVLMEEWATEIHHVWGRGIHYLNTDTWISICEHCHRWLHAHPSEARRLGLLK